ncbi:MAG TPA: hypothetical protein VGK32_15265 [Vicinamibacterales bacterium]|jgi:hypothetical protein
MDYKDPSWNYPEGDLGSDQRHRGRIFANDDMGLGRFGRLGVGVLQMLNSGSPYGAVAGIDMRPYVANPGYTTAQGGSTVQYYFAARDAYRGDWMIRTDLSLNYSYRVGKVEAFWQGQVLNLFDRAAVTGVANLNQNVFTAASPGTIRGLAAFNAFTTAPVAGVNYVLDPGTTSRDLAGNPVAFGQPLSANAYQTPRTFRMSFGVRF